MAGTLHGPQLTGCREVSVVAESLWESSGTAVQLDGSSCDTMADTVHGPQLTGCREVSVVAESLWESSGTAVQLNMDCSY